MRNRFKILSTHELDKLSGILFILAQPGSFFFGDFRILLDLPFGFEDERVKRLIAATPAGPPAAPTVTGVTSGNGQATVAFTPPTVTTTPPAGTPER